MDMAVVRYTELYGEAPEAEIVGKLTMVSDLEPDEVSAPCRGPLLPALLDQHVRG